MKNKINHIGIIPDGNRRWAEKNNCSLFKAYFISCEKLFFIFYKLFEQYSELNEISIYLLSYENIKKRSKSEINLILNVGEKFLNKEYNNLPNKYMINWVGLDEFDKVHINHKVFQKLKEFNYNGKLNNKTVNLIAGYNPEKDLMMNCSMNENILSKTAIKSNIDLVIRTGNEMRLSGFLPYHTKYSELSFLKKYMPDLCFTEVELEIEKYKKSHRRYGQ